MISRRVLLTASLTLFGSACTRLSFLAANIPARLGGYRRMANQVYGVQSRHRLDVYLPAQAAAAPVVVFFHGGGWSSGDKDDYQFVGAALAEQGCIAVLPDYRLYPEVKFPGFMQDAAQALAWVINHLGDWQADAGRVYLMGHSAGAHIAMLLALDGSYLQQVGLPQADTHNRLLRGVIGLSGPYDFIPFSYDYMFDLFGPPERYAQSQPINFVRPDLPPMLLVHGLQDHTVVPDNTRHLEQALRSQGVPVTVHYYPQASHSDVVAAFSIPARGRVSVLDDVRAFMLR